MPISQFSEGLQKVISFLPGTYGTSLLRIHALRGVFREMDSPFLAARYHSLAALEETLPEVLKVTARAEDGEVMAVEHRDYPIFGVQFHPESVMTPEGKTMIKNFMEIVKHD